MRPMKNTNGSRAFKWLGGACVMCWALVLCASKISSQMQEDKNVQVDKRPAAFQDRNEAATSAAATRQGMPGESPMLPGHVDQREIDKGELRLEDLIEAGRFLFVTQFNVLDGFGRPAATGDGKPTKRVAGSAPFMIRTSAPETNSCAGCHNQPVPGGAGDFVANVFVLAQVRDPVTDSVSAEFSDERNTLGMHGSGAIEMLAREMSMDLIGIREAAKNEARMRGIPVTKALVTKGVNFGQIMAGPDGSIDTSKVEGVDGDLIIKPYHQKGVVNSVRVFTVNAFNHHHGMEAVERFGRDRTGEDDFDEDGVPDELSVGDITAATIFQVSLPVPGRALPEERELRDSVRRGETAFTRIGCAGCHRSELILNNPVYSEPNPFNPVGNLRPQDVARPFSFDLTRDGPRPHLERISGGRAVVRAYTDLKRHTIADEADPFFANERVVQGGVPLDQFITRKLWDVGSSAPYGHRGNLTTISEAILHHAGEARPTRESFAALPVEEQADIVAFLKTLQVLPEGSPNEISIKRIKAFKRQE